MSQGRTGRDCIFFKVAKGDNIFSGLRKKGEEQGIIQGRIGRGEVHYILERRSFTGVERKGSL
jgi:hypothetical protein